MGKTTYYKFKLPNTNTRDWGAQINYNFNLIDGELNSTNQKINSLLAGQFLPISLYTVEVGDEQQECYLLGYDAIESATSTTDGTQIDDSNNIVAEFLAIPGGKKGSMYSNDLFVYGTIARLTSSVQFTAIGYISKLTFSAFKDEFKDWSPSTNSYLCFGDINQQAFGVCTTIIPPLEDYANSFIYRFGCRDDQLIVPSWIEDASNIELYPQTLGGYYHPEPTLGTNKQNYTRVPGFKSPDTLVVDVGTTGYNLSAVQQATDLDFTETTTCTITTDAIFTTLPTTGFTLGNIQPKIEFYTKFGSSHTVIMPCYTITPIYTGNIFNKHWTITVTSQLPIKITMVVTMYGT